MALPDRLETVTIPDFSTAPNNTRLLVTDENQGAFLLFTPSEPEGMPLVLAGNNYYQLRSSIDGVLRLALKETDLEPLGERELRLLKLRYGLDDGKIKPIKIVVQMLDDNTTTVDADGVLNRAFSKLGLLGLKQGLTDLASKKSSENAPITAKQIEARELVAQTQAGNLEPFSLFYETQRSKVFGFIEAKLGDIGDSEDVTAETFIRLFIAIDRNGFRYIPNATLYSLLFRIARNEIVNFNRRNQRTIHGEVSLLASEKVDPSPSPEQRVVQKEMLGWAIRQLSPAQREVISLRFVSDLSIEEIATALGKTENNVKVLISKALAQMRKLTGTQTVRKRNPIEPKEYSLKAVADIKPNSTKHFFLIALLDSSEPLSLDALSRLCGIKIRSVDPIIQVLRDQYGLPIERAKNAFFIENDKKEQLRRDLGLS